ncbi:hypothetical protein FOFC_02297, partial [Fusarium oxysporum]
LLCGQGSPLVPRSPAEAAKKKVSEQYATAEIGQAASELQKGQRTMWGPCVKVEGRRLEGTRGPRKSSSRRLFVLFGQLKLQKSVLREVEGHRGRNVAGSRSRNVEVRRSRR